MFGGVSEFFRVLEPDVVHLHGDFVLLPFQVEQLVVGVLPGRVQLESDWFADFVFDLDERTLVGGLDHFVGHGVC